jgi:hypothetical protein
MHRHTGTCRRALRHDPGSETRRAVWFSISVVAFIVVVSLLLLRSCEFTNSAPGSNEPSAHITMTEQDQL